VTAITEAAARIIGTRQPAASTDPASAQADERDLGYRQPRLASLLENSVLNWMRRRDW